MRNTLIYILLTGIVLLGQHNGKRFGVSASWSYTTSSRLYYFPNAADAYLRNQYIELNDINSSAFSLRYGINENFMVGLNIGYYNHTGYSKTVIATSETETGRFEAADGYKIIPLELTGYYILPFSTEQFKFYMGGGIGYYFGEFRRDLGNIEISSELNNTPLGIHVNIGVEYFYYEYFGIFTEMKFRDPELELSSRYITNSFVYLDKVYTIQDDKFDTRVNIDGVIFSLGVTYLFNFPY